MSGAGKPWEDTVHRHGGGFKKIPSTPEQDEMRDWLLNLVRQGAPEQQIAGMSEAETQGMSLLQSLLSGEYEYEMEDPRYSQFWKGFREESKAGEAENVSALRRRQQMGGMYRSSTGESAEGKYRAAAGAKRSQVLGGLYEREREISRQEPYRQLSAAFGYGGLPRNIEQGRMDAAYGKEMFPYTTQAPWAQALLSEGRYAYIPPVIVQRGSQLSQIRGNMQTGMNMAGMFMPSFGGSGYNPQGGIPGLDKIQGTI